MFLNDIDVTDYKKHPRILELRFIATYDMWYKEFGERADGIMTGLATAFNCDITKLRAVANQNLNIRKLSKENKLRYMQEIIFMGEVWQEKRFTVSSKYLNLHQRSLYRSNVYMPNHFVTKEWLSELDDEVVTCGLKQYALEVLRFLEALDVFRKVI